MTDLPLAVLLAGTALLGALLMVRHYRQQITRLRDTSADRELFDISNEAILILAKETGELVDVNARFASLFGYPVEEAARQSLGSLSQNQPPYTEADAATWIRKARHAGPQLFEWHARHRDGHLFWVEVSVRQVQLGGKTRIIAAIRDVSERKLIEQQASDLERRMKEVYENLPIAVFAIDAEHRVTFWNPPLAAMTGVEAATIIGTRDCWRGFYSQARPCMSNLLVDGLDAEALERFYAGKYRPSGVLPGALEAEDFYPRMAAGKGLWLQFTAAPLRDAAGQVVGAITTLVDITRSKAAEALVLRERNFLETLIEANPTPVFYKDRLGHYLGCNDAFLKTTGRKREEVIGKTVFDIAPQRIAQEYFERDEALYAHPGRQVYDYVVHQSGGGVRNVIFHKATFRNPQGDVAGLIGVVLDVTDLKRAEQSLQDLNLQLEARVAARTGELEQAMGKLVHAEKLAALGSLVAGIAHELNTPIGNGLTVASALDFKVQAFTKSAATGLRRSTLDQFVSEARLAADLLVRSMTRAAELVSNFKQVAVDQTSSQRRQFGLPALVDEIVFCLQPLVDESGCEVCTEIEATLALDSYPGPLGQVLSNLITNALIHGFEASAPGTVAVHARRVDSQRLLITLSDNGRGIDLADQRRIFEPFFTTRLGHGGSGLGLHVVHNIVTGVLGGQIEVRSSPGAGTTFLLNLPVAAPRTAVVEWVSP
ncbi:PAS domain S-box protein [Rhodoferax sp.]|uniref:PAS domain S-box protein n=1 Tax=Rhodoferax sp. TaxID=50421 RepID=UPI0027756BC3|nr:PAS domain S-box protein [Rhodoferax sp.]